MYYLVMAMSKSAKPANVHYDVHGHEIYSGTAYDINWQVAGVFAADKAEDACKAAAKKGQRFGSFLAVEGFPWGIDLFEVDAEEFGVDSEPMTRLKQLENRSREMEKEAGIAE